MIVFHQLCRTTWSLRVHRTESVSVMLSSTGSDKKWWNLNVSILIRLLLICRQMASVSFVTSSALSAFSLQLPVAQAKPHCSHPTTECWRTISSQTQHPQLHSETVVWHYHVNHISPHKLWASFSHLCASVTKQYKLVPAKGRWCLVAGE